MPDKTVNCKVIRAFRYKSEVLEVDSTHRLPFVFAREMQSASKVEFVEDEVVIAGGPDEVDPVDE